jgi:hypothetical protein
MVLNMAVIQGNEGHGEENKDPVGNVGWIQLDEWRCSNDEAASGKVAEIPEDRSREDFEVKMLRSQEVQAVTSSSLNITVDGGLKQGLFTVVSFWFTCTVIMPRRHKYDSSSDSSESESDYAAPPKVYILRKFHTVAAY